MKISCTTNIADIVLNEPVKQDDIAVSLLQDKDDNPIVLSIEKKVEEHVHNATNRAYIDIELKDSEHLNYLKGLDNHCVSTVYSRHSEPAWFDKQLPEEIVHNYYKSCITLKQNKEIPFIRIKTAFNQKDKLPALNLRSQKEGDESTIIDNLSELDGKTIVYYVHLNSLRFLKKSFCCEFILQSIEIKQEEVQAKQEVEKPESDASEQQKKQEEAENALVEDINLANMILNNSAHRESNEKQEQDRLEKLEKQRQYLQSLEKLKLVVEEEVANILKKREDLEQDYSNALEEIKLLEEQSIESNSSNNYQYHTDDELVEQDIIEEIHH